MTRSSTRWMTLPNGRKLKEQVYENCTIYWITYTGDKLHQTAHRHTADGCRVVIKGMTASITLPNGKSMTKRVGHAGFAFAVGDPRKNPPSAMREVGHISSGC